MHLLQKGNWAFTVHPHIPGSVPAAYSGLYFHTLASGKRGGRNKTGVRTGISGRNPLRWLPTERLSEWGYTDCEYWANSAENTRIKDYRILVCVPLLLGEFCQIFCEFFELVLD